MTQVILLFFLGLFFLSGVRPAYSQNSPAQCGKSCCVVSVKTPPILVVPTGFDSATGEDAVERRRERKYANYVTGTKSVTQNGSANGKSFALPKRSIVQVSDVYRDVIERNGEFARTDRWREWVPVRVLSVPPENKKLQESRLQATSNIAKPTFTQNSEIAEVGSRGFVKVSDLEKIDKQKDYVFVVKQDTELFRALNETLQSNSLQALEPYVLRLKETDTGFEVRQCCSGDPVKCVNFPIFEVLNVKDRSGRGVDVPVDTDCFSCQNQIFSSLTPIEEHHLNPIRSLLSHPSLGLPTGRKVSSIADLNFVDSRGFVQIPLLDQGGEKRVGPFNSRHYGPERGDADAYLRPDVACGFMQFLKSWDQTCKGNEACVIEFGDASHAYHKGKVRTANSPWPHESHTDGECIDINTSRMESRYRGHMMKMLQQLGQTQCLTMDRNILKQGGCSYDASGVHDTHLHICFPSNTKQSGGGQRNSKLSQACQRGVVP